MQRPLLLRQPSNCLRASFIRATIESPASFSYSGDHQIAFKLLLLGRPSNRLRASFNSGNHRFAFELHSGDHQLAFELLFKSGDH
jgi:hypothetical protein